MPLVILPLSCASASEKTSVSCPTSFLSQCNHRYRADSIIEHGQVDYLSLASRRRLISAYTFSCSAHERPPISDSACDLSKSSIPAAASEIRFADISTRVFRLIRFLLIYPVELHARIRFSLPNRLVCRTQRCTPAFGSRADRISSISLRSSEERLSRLVQNERRLGRAY